MFLGVSAASLRKWSDQGIVQVYRTPGGQRRTRLTTWNSSSPPCASRRSEARRVPRYGRNPTRSATDRNRPPPRSQPPMTERPTRARDRDPVGRAAPPCSAWRSAARRTRIGTSPSSASCRARRRERPAASRGAGLPDLRLGELPRDRPRARCSPASRPAVIIGVVTILASWARERYPQRLPADQPGHLRGVPTGRRARLRGGLERALDVEPAPTPSTCWSSRLRALAGDRLRPDRRLLVLRRALALLRPRSAAPSSRSSRPSWPRR